MQPEDTSLFHGTLVTSRRIIYTPSSFAKASLLYLQETGHLKAQKPHTSRRQDLVSYLFFIVMSGSGSLSYEGHTTELHPGDCVFLDCTRPYSHTTSRDLWELEWAHFCGPSMSGIYEKYRERGGQSVFHPKAPEPYTDCLNALYEIADSDDHIRDMKINEKLSSLLSLIMEESWHPEKTGRPAAADRTRRLSEVKAYLDEHYKETVVLEDLAKNFGFNKFYLTRIFREQYGMTIGNYVLLARIGRAKQLLRFSDMTMETISAEIGMHDASYFSRIFRKVEGISPGEYRKMW